MPKLQNVQWLLCNLSIGSEAAHDVALAGQTSVWGERAQGVRFGKLTSNMELPGATGTDQFSFTIHCTLQATFV